MIPTIVKGPQMHGSRCLSLRVSENLRIYLPTYLLDEQGLGERFMFITHMGARNQRSIVFKPGNHVERAVGSVCFTQKAHLIEVVGWRNNHLPKTIRYHRGA